MKAPRKHNNINSNSIIKKDNIQHMRQTQKKKYNSRYKPMISNWRWYARFKWLYVTDEPLTGNTTDPDHTLDRKTKLRKDMKVKFTLGDSEELKSATRISRSGKATGKYKNAWNSQLDDGTIASIYFGWDFFLWKLYQILIAIWKKFIIHKLI